MKCFKCAGFHFEEQSMRFNPKVKNEIVEVVVRSNVCKACNSPLLEADQVNAFRRAAADKYRENHELLTSREIIALRESFGMSQKLFAEYLGVGEASIKRWETYYVQDESQDDHIRVRCDSYCAQLNFLNLDRHFSIPDLFNGMKLFSLDLFRQSILFFIKNTQASTSLLPQLNFYADFLNFKKTQKSITGTRYVPLKSGPYPDQCNLLLKVLEKQKSIVQEGNSYRINREPDLSVFDDSEKGSLGYVCAAYQKRGQRLTELSRSEKAYVDADDLSYMSYGYAKDLLI